MARIRTIKPEFWRSPSTATASPRARLLYIAMWNWADDYGVGEWTPRELLAFAFPNDEDVTVKGFQSLCKEVADCFGTQFYTVGGRRYYCVPAWDEHQKTERRAQGKNPRPEDSEAAPDRDFHVVAEKRGNSAAKRGKTPAGKGTGEQGKGNRGTGEVAAQRADEALFICNLLADLIEGNGSNRPEVTNGWLDAARLLLDKDNRTAPDAIDLIRFSQWDAFWKTNILSMPKFREKYDQLRLKREAQTQQPKSKAQARTENNLHVVAMFAAQEKGALEA